MAGENGLVEAQQQNSQKTQGQKLWGDMAPSMACDDEVSTVILKQKKLWCESDYYSSKVLASNICICHPDKLCILLMVMVPQGL